MNNEETQDESQDEAPLPENFAALVARINVVKFRKSLVRWIVQDQIPFSTIKSVRFQEVLLYLQPGIERFLVNSHNTISSWVDSDYQQARQTVKIQLNASLSRIHFSFDIWTSPAYTAIVGICAHFLTLNLTLKNAFLDLKEIEGAH